MGKRSSQTRTIPKKSKNKYLSLFSDIWPQERDFIERPERIKYVRKILPLKNCVFCEAKKRKIGPDSLLLFKSRHAMLIINKYPYNSGHVMVLPVRHCGDLTELTNAEYYEIMSLLRLTVKVVKKEYHVGGINVGLNMGAVAGAGIPSHLHWHIIPRWSGDTNFFPLIAETKVLPETLQQTFKRYFRHFSKLRLEKSEEN